MKLSFVKVQSDITNWPAVAAGLSLALFMGVIVAIAVKASPVVLAVLATLGATGSVVAWIDAVWEGYERRKR